MYALICWPKHNLCLVAVLPSDPYFNEGPQQIVEANVGQHQYVYCAPRRQNDNDAVYELVQAEPGNKSLLAFLQLIEDWS